MSAILENNRMSKTLGDLMNGFKEEIEAQSIDDWKSCLIVKMRADGTQTIPCRVHNIILILRNDPEFKGRIQFDELLNQITVDDEVLDEALLGKLKANFEKNYFSEKVPTSDINDGLVVVACDHKYNPIKRYLEGLRWDGFHRVKGLFFNYFGAEDSDYSMAVSQSFLVSAVARIFSPGCKVDTMIVLEGAQGTFKSSAIAALFSQKWHSEISANITDKDFFQNLRGKWCMEFGEMSGVKRADSDHIKQILTTCSDNYRPSYGRFNRDFPRQNIFVGTTNNTVYLIDATGARRYFPISCGSIDLDAIVADRDQLWAEALHLYKSGANWWNIPDANVEQDKRFDSDSWETVVLEWLLDSQRAFEFSRYPERLTTERILREAINLEVAKHGRAEQTRVGAVMRRLGYVTQQTREDDKRFRYYRRL